MKEDKITKKIIDAAFRVLNALAARFLEKMYENGLALELKKSGLLVSQQEAIKVWYDGVIVGHDVADTVVEGQIVVERKTVREFDDLHLAQCHNDPKATRHRLCLSLNFGNPRVEVKHLVRD